MSLISFLGLRTSGSLRPAQRTGRHVRLSVETLEERAVPDASIRIMFPAYGGILVIEGTDHPEAFHITRTTTAGGGPAIEVTGLEQNGRPTTFNGGQTRQLLPGYPYNIDARLRGGDDILIVQNFPPPKFVAGNHKIDAGHGNDLVQYLNVTVSGTTDVKLGAGQDTISLLDSTFHKLAMFDGGAGRDVFADLGSNGFLSGRHLKGMEQVQPGTSPAGTVQRRQMRLTASGHPTQVQVVQLSNGAILETVAISDGSSSLGSWQGSAVVYVTPDGSRTFALLTMRFGNGDTLRLALRNDWVQNAEHPNGAFLGTYHVLSGTGSLTGASGSGNADILFLGEQGEEVLLTLQGGLAA